MDKLMNILKYINGLCSKLVNKTTNKTVSYEKTINELDYFNEKLI